MRGCTRLYLAGLRGYTHTDLLAITMATAGTNRFNGLSMIVVSWTPAPNNHDTERGVMKLFTAEHITPGVIAKELQASLLLSSPGVDSATFTIWSPAGVGEQVMTSPHNSPSRPICRWAAAERALS